MSKRRIPTTSPTHTHPLNNAPVYLQQLYQYDQEGYVNCRVFLDASNKIGYVLLTEGYQFDDIMHPYEFYEGFGKAFKQMVDGGAENLIFDMRGHEGYYYSTMEAVMDFLLHNSTYPRGTESDMVKSPSNTEIAHFFKKHPEKMGLDWSEWQPMIKQYDEETVVKVHMDRSQFPPKPFTAEHSTRVYCEECIPDGISKAYGGYSPFDAQHLYFITDGDCYGGCAEMTLQALELNSARVLGYGWNPAYENNFLTYVPGSCTGSYWGTDVIDELLAMDEQNTIDISKFPKPWERDSPYIYFSFSHFETFNRNPYHYGQSLMYSNVTVQEILPFQVSPWDHESPESFEEIAQKILDLYISSNYCFGGEVRVDPACQNDNRTALHQRYGRPCDTIDNRSQFNMTECQFASCEEGYYINGTHLDGGGICIPIPGGTAPTPPPPTVEDPSPETQSKNKFPGWGAALIVIIVLLALVIVIMVVGYFVVTYLKKGQSSSSSSSLMSGSGSRSSFSDADERRIQGPPSIFSDEPVKYQYPPPGNNVEEEVEEEVD